MKSDIVFETYHHVPVLTNEVMKYLQCEPGKVYHEEDIEFTIIPDVGY
jgi:hypothetical protein